MTRRSSIQCSITTFAKRVVLFLTVTVSSLALAQAVPTIGATGSGQSMVPYRGTSVSYGHSMSAYNYTEPTRVWTHRLGLMPEWHFTEAFYLRSRFFLTQEFTPSNTTTYLHEVELSDLWVDAVWSGFRERVTGIRLAGDIRATLPTSKQSQAATRLFTLGPSANISRTFKVLSGLTLTYSTRFTLRFNRLSTRQNQGGLISNCTIANPEACTSTETGVTNMQYDLLHGPTVVFNPHARVNIAASLFMQRGWVPALSATDLVPAVPVQTRDFIGFAVSATWQPWDFVGFTLGAFTFANQLDLEGKTIFPLFNRNTSASLDATFDLEAVVSSITKEKK